MIWRTRFGRCIYQKDGVKVYDNFLYRWLTFDSKAIQTLVNKFNLSSPGLHYISPLIDPIKLQPSACCLLGLGGGSVIHALMPYLNDTKFLIVEKEQAIIKIAKEFFYLNKFPSLNIVCNDAFQFLTDTDKKFDYLIVDLFDANYFPTNCFQKDFFAACQNVLASEGLLAVNVANVNERKPILTWIKACFDDNILTIPVKKSANIILLAGSKECLDTYIEQLKRAKALKKLLWEKDWGKIVIQ